MADYTGGNTDMLNIGRSGFGGGSFIETLLGYKLIAGDDNKCCAPATKDDVCAVDRDLLDKASEIKDAIKDGNYNELSVLKDGFYGLMSSQKDTQNMIQSGNEKILGAIETNSLKQRNQYLEDELDKCRRYAHCGHPVTVTP